jgi:Photosynthesis system II assembly factor YCF48
MVELVTALALLVGPPPLSGPTAAWGNSSHAWVGGGAIFATTDGGATWRRQSPWPASQLAAVDARHAWALSVNGETIRTTDGSRWSVVGVHKLQRLSFVDDEHGFALSRDDVVLRTGDGGSTWSPTASPQRLQSICFSTPNTGWAARGGTVWTTRDGGAHWTFAQLLSARGGLPVPDLACRGTSVWAVFHGGAAAGSEGYAVFRSRDAGRHWRAVYGQFLRRGLPRIDAYAGPVAVLPGGDAWLEGSCAPCGRGTVTLVHGKRRTTFGGWQPGPLAFADRRHGLLVLTNERTGVPSVWRTANGATWHRVLRSRLLVA